MAPVRDDSLKEHQPAPKPIEQVQVGERILLPGHPMPRIVNSKQTLPDGTIILHLGIDPDDNPDDAAFDSIELANRFHDACLEAQYTGARHVKTGLEAYVELAKMPFYEVTGAGLAALSNKAAVLIVLSVDSAKAAEEAAALAGKARALAARLRQGVGEAKTAEEAAQLSQAATRVEKDEAALEAGAQELTEVTARNQSAATAARNNVQEVQAAQAATIGNSAGLPLSTQASVESKLTNYLLAPLHPVGGPKAEWFKQALGFTKENQAQLAGQIVFNEAQAVQTGATQFGTKFNQTISITGANGKVIPVQFSWIRNNDEVVRLVTAIPTKR